MKISELSKEQVVLEVAHDDSRSGWRKVASAAVDDPLKVVVAVKQRNIEQLEAILSDISNISSPNYGDHWDNDRISDFVRNPVAGELVRSFAEAHNLDVVSTTRNGEYITLSGSVRSMELAFSTKFDAFHRVDSTADEDNDVVLRAPSYSLPSNVAEQVACVMGIVHLPPLFQSFHKNTTNLPLSPSNVVTPSFLNSHYGILTHNGMNRFQQGIYSTKDHYVSPSDLQQFQSLFQVPQQPISRQVGDHVAEGHCGRGNTCVEANLDAQYLSALAQDLPIMFYYWSNQYDFMVGWLQELAQMTDIPKVFVIGFGANEREVPLSYAQQFNTEAIKICMQGVTLIAAAGDNGAHRFDASGDSSKCDFSPVFPASSPYVTSVGSTMGPEAGSAEVAMQGSSSVSTTSGGGFSLHYARPSFQDAAVNSYLHLISHTPDRAPAPASGFNREGRGYPDVSGLGHNFMIVVNGRTVLTGGTSASAPVFAAMISLVNAQRMSLGLSTLGWVNPALYSTSSLWAKDISSGDNKCTGAYSGMQGAYQVTCCMQGYYAVSGWDPVTGLGSVNYPAFLLALSSLANLNNQINVNSNTALATTANVSDAHGNSNNQDHLHGMHHGMFCITMALGLLSGILAMACYLLCKSRYDHHHDHHDHHDRRHHQRQLQRMHMQQGKSRGGLFRAVPVQESIVEDAASPILSDISL